MTYRAAGPIRFEDIEEGMSIRSDSVDEEGAPQSICGVAHDKSRKMVLVGDMFCDSDETFTLAESFGKKPQPPVDGIYRLTTGICTGGLREVREGHWQSSNGGMLVDYQGYDDYEPVLIPTVPEGHITIAREVAKRIYDHLANTRGYSYHARALGRALDGDPS